jgi:hypothetical protein
LCSLSVAFSDALRCVNTIPRLIAVLLAGRAKIIVASI